MIENKNKRVAEIMMKESRDRKAAEYKNFPLVGSLRMSMIRVLEFLPLVEKNFKSRTMMMITSVDESHRRL
jgi:hypothetical protein